VLGVLVCLCGTVHFRRVSNIDNMLTAIVILNLKNEIKGVKGVVCEWVGKVTDSRYGFSKSEFCIYLRFTGF